MGSRFGISNVDVRWVLEFSGSNCALITPTLKVVDDIAE